MGGVKIMVEALLMLLAFAAVVSGENKTWPDFSCFGDGKMGNDIAQRKYDFHLMQVNQCANTEKREGMCAKVCYLKWNFLLHQPDGGNDPVVLETEEFASHVAHVHDADYGHKAIQAIILRLEKCNKDHPEIPGMWKHMRSPCKVWEPILNCIDKAIGC